MRLAILADIHGNLPALKAVHQDLDDQEVDEVLVAGDLVGRGPQGSAVVKYVRRQGWPTLGGNHEEYLLDFRRRQVPEEWWQDEEWAASRWLAAELDDDDESFIGDLPFMLRRPGLAVVHGTPTSNREGIGPWTSGETLRRHVAGLGAQMLVCAHIHRPLIAKVADTTGADTTVVNVGSVGLPFNRDPRAQYGIFNRQDGTWQCQLRQVPYDRQEIYTIYSQCGFLEHGGVTAELLRLELEHATPLLVPFLAWARSTSTPPTRPRLADFLAVFQPGQSLRRFMESL